MNRKRVHQFAVNGLTLILAVIIAALPFHAFLTVWGNSLIGHYTALRLWKEVLLAIGVALAIYILATTAKLRRRMFSDRLIKIIALYILVTLVWGTVSLWLGSVTPKAMLYGILLNCRFFVMFVLAWIAASQSPWLRRYWQRLLAYPAIIVVGFGLTQRYLLPYDFLKHFGYGPATISPYETIDHKVSYIRVASTLRGANMFGGYLIIVISYLAAVSHWLKRRWLIWLAMTACLVALYASGSRGAWLGCLVALLVVAGLRSGRRLLKARFVIAAAALIILLAGGLFAARNNDFVQNTFFHTDEHSRSDESSNAAHLRTSWAAAKQVFRVDGALGRGPGTAGPASFYNGGHPALIAENYFLQIGQEVGWLGLGLFLAIYLSVAQLLWKQRGNALGQTLLASLAGLTVMAMLMHIWTDDTISYIWWTLAGVALAPAIAVKNREKQNNRGKKRA